MGSIEYIVSGGSFTRLMMRLSSEQLPFTELCENGEDLHICVPLGQCRRFLRICKEVGLKVKLIRRRGAVRLLEFIKHRTGLVAGCIITGLLMIYYSNVILKITIDTDDPFICKKVMAVLEEDGVVPGAYLPDIDLVLEERAIKSSMDEISWAGISRMGSGIAVDVIENITAPKGMTKGLPCHLTACEDGIIEEIQVLDGQLMAGIGSGVTKGDIVVSGKMVSTTSEWDKEGEVVTENVRYVRSIGKIRGSFTRTEVFTQPLDCEVKAYTGRHEKLRYLCFFSANIPLFTKIPEGSFDAREERYFPAVGEFMLPIGTKALNLREYDIRSQVIEKDEAQQRLEEAEKRYEENFLTGYEIRGKSQDISFSEDKAILTVTYDLYGDLCEEQDFFIPRSILPDTEKSHEKNVQNSENN